MPKKVEKESKKEEKQEQKQDETIAGGKSCKTGYCVKCKKKQQMKDCKNSKSSNGRNMIKGLCKVCGTKMNVFTK